MMNYIVTLPIYYQWLKARIGNGKFRQYKLVDAQQVDADAIIHYGYACLSRCVSDTLCFKWISYTMQDLAPTSYLCFWQKHQHWSLCSNTRRCAEIACAVQSAVHWRPNTVTTWCCFHLYCNCIYQIWEEHNAVETKKDGLVHELTSN